MKGFVIAVATLVLISVLTVWNAVHYRETVNEILGAAEAALAATGEEKRERTEECMQLLKDSENTLHLTLRRSRIDALKGKLRAAQRYCTERDEKEANVQLALAVEELDACRRAELLTVWNIL